MRLGSARDLKRELLDELVTPLGAAASRLGTTGVRSLARAAAARGLDPEELVFGMGARPIGSLSPVQRSLALGVAPDGKGSYRLAIRLQRGALRDSPLVEGLAKRARGEVDVRLVGRIDKRRRTRKARRARVAPWYQRDARPLLIGASIGHFGITAGTLGAFVRRGRRHYVLSNNHVLADEDRASAGDAILRRAPLAGGRDPAQRVARLRHWIRLRARGANHVDAALAELDEGVACDPSRLRGLIGGRDRRLAGLGPAFLDAGAIVHKLGRTTGATRGRVTAFDVDNLVVKYDAGNRRFDGQIEIEGAGRRAFSDGGDSGSLVVDARMRAVALLFAGSESGGRNGLGLSYANPIRQVLGDLRATLLP